MLNIESGGITFKTLFHQWKQEHHIDAFISDGIVDPEHYAQPHILFVLRDMNCRQACDLCADLRNEGSGWKTWNNIGRWTTALLDGDPVYPFDMSSTKRIDQLRRVAVMNVKKEGGGHRAVGAEIEAAVQEQAALIRQEISMCSPSLIVCCGISSGKLRSNAVLLDEYVLERTTKWMTFDSAISGRAWWYYYAMINGKQVPVISFCHPQVTVLGKSRGHEKLFKPLYQDMLTIRKMFLQGKEE